MENIYFLPFDKPLNAWDNVINSILTLRKQKEGKIDINDIDIFNSLKEWLLDKKDPLAFLITLELILTIRANVEKKDETFFIQNEYYDFLNEVLTNLMFIDKENIPERTKLIGVLWRIRLLLARYYLKYIDLNLEDNLNDDQKVALSWWMARQLCNVLIQYTNNLEINSKMKWLESQIKNIIEPQLDLIGFSHLFRNEEKNISLNRYNTLEGHHLLTTATLALLIPYVDDANNQNIIFKGLIYPTESLSSEIIEEFIEKLNLHIILGDGQVVIDKKSELPVLWNIPLCKSVPLFLKKYYAKSFDLLGKEKIQIIQLAESIKLPDFLDLELPNLFKYIKNKNGAILTIILSSLKKYLYISGEMPKKSDILKKRNTLINDINNLNQIWSDICIPILGQIFYKLQIFNELDWCETFSKLFKKLNYSQFSEKIINNLITDLVAVILLGGDFKLFKSFSNLKNENKHVRNSLIGIKRILEYLFPQVTVEYRENVRKILNELENLPVSNNKEFL